MIIVCYLCGTDFEIDEEVFLRDYDPLNDDEYDICDDCYNEVLDWIISRN